MEFKKLLLNCKQKLLTDSCGKSSIFCHISKTSTKHIDFYELLPYIKNGNIVLTNRIGDEKQIKLFSKVRKIANKAYDIKNETGEEVLKLGFPIIECYWSDEHDYTHVVKAPIFFWKLFPKKSIADEIEIEISPEYEINTQLLAVFKEQNKIVIDDEQIFNVENAAEILKQFKIVRGNVDICKDFFQCEPFNFADEDKKNFAKRVVKEDIGKISKYAALGIFESTSYDILCFYDLLLKNNEKTLNDSFKQNGDIKKIGFVNDADFSQINVIKDCLKKKYVNYSRTSRNRKIANYN